MTFSQAPLPLGPGWKFTLMFKASSDAFWTVSTASLNMV